MRSGLVILAAVVVGIAGCGTTAATPSPSSVAPSALPPSTLPPSLPVGSGPPPVTPTGAPTPEPTLGVGSLAVTVSDRLRVRSQPRVSDDSILHEPVLPLGTQLAVIGGPVNASGYTWWRVEPVSFLLDDATTGWVAMADHDGEPWIALAGAGTSVPTLAISGLARAAPDPADAQTASRSVNAFGLDLYRQLLEDGTLADDENAVFSPASIALALAMARAGARGDTAAEMDEVLHARGWDELAAGLNALDQALGSRNAEWTDYDDSPRQVALRIANASFGQRDWTIEPGFLDAIASAFGSGLRLVDFIADPEAARGTINAWVSRQTEGRIPELLAPPDVSSETRLYLVNAIYLKAEWARWFDEDATQPASFTRLDGSKATVQMMHRIGGSMSGVIPYARGDAWQAVELMYRAAPETPSLAMMLILPDDLRSFERSADAEALASIASALDAERNEFAVDQCPSVTNDAGCYPYDLSLYMPRFSIDTRAGLEESLAAAGMPRAFDPATADFTGINPTEQLFISKVIHQANIDVDEKGTEAAAATAVGLDTGGGPGPLDHITFRLDRPFLFALRDTETGAVLFMGRVVDPSVTR